MFPEIFRHRVAELTKKRMVLGFITIQVICGCFILTANASNLPALSVVTIFWGFQTLLLVGYGSIRLSQSISGEKSDKTWDFIRLTPQTSKQIVIGKFIGAPIYSYFLFISVLPWTIFYYFQLELITANYFEWISNLSLAGIFLIFQSILLLSAYSEGRKKNTSYTWNAVFIFMIVPSLCGFILNLSESQEKLITFYNTDIPSREFLFASFILFGVWAFFGSCWKVGEDLLEEPKVWRLPAFLIFLAFYIAGLGKANSWSIYRNGANNFDDIPSFLSIGGVALFSYFVAFMNRSGIDDWKEILFHRKGLDRLHYLPKWIVALATIFLISFVIVMAVPKTSWVGWLFFLVPLFLMRDLLFLQFCRLTASRKPEIMAIIYLSLAYILPPIVCASMKWNLYYYFAPAPKSQNDIFSFIPILIQNLIMISLVTFQARKRIPT